MKFTATPQTGRVIDMLKRWKFATVTAPTFTVEIADGIVAENGSNKSLREIAEILMNGRADMPARPFFKDYFENSTEWQEIIARRVRKRLRRNTNGLPMLEVYVADPEGACFEIENSIRQFVRNEYNGIGAPWSASYRKKIEARNASRRSELGSGFKNEPEYRAKAVANDIRYGSPSLLYQSGALTNAIMVTKEGEAHWSAQTGQRTEPSDGARGSRDATLADTQATAAGTTYAG